MILRAAIFSFGIYLKIWFSSFASGARTRTPLSFLRILWLFIVFPLLMGAQGLNWFFLVLDELLFPAYRNAQLPKPVFISGIPRSGTTFVHREFAATGSLNTMTTWEAILAPSVTQRKILRLLAKLDRSIGNPFKKTINLAVASQTKEFNNIHAVGLDAPEEDYLSLLPAAGCFILVLLFPHSSHLWKLSNPADLDPKTCQLLLNLYRSLVQRHIYSSSSPQKQFLSKNAIFGAWLPYLKKMFPDGKFIICIREPQAALSSQLSSIRGGVDLFGSDREFKHFPTEFVSVYTNLFQALIHFSKNTSSNLSILDQQILRKNSQEYLQQTADSLELSFSKKTLEETELQETSESAHHLRADRVDLSGFNSEIKKMDELYQQLLKDAPLTTGESISD